MRSISRRWRRIRGDIALIQLRYSDAATHYEAAAAQDPPSAAEDKVFYLVQAGTLE